MPILTDPIHLATLGPLHLAIGVFDGLHLGHQAVIRPAIDAAKKDGGRVVIVSFDPHPAKVLAPSKAPRMLTSIEHKAQLSTQILGVDHILAVSFDREFAELSADAFIRKLCTYPIRSVSVGENFQFGKNRGGNVKMLHELGAELKFEVHAAPLIQIGEQVVSSTSIRAAIEAGQLDLAEEYLGRRFSVLGRVIKGRQLGRTLGFPTANLQIDSELLPPNGVYAVRTTRANDHWHGVANLGVRPTVEGGDPERLLEVHLFGLNSDIYHERLEVEFVEFLRQEKKFSGIEALKNQITKDAETARRILASS